jgi:uncharacterized phage protein (TIGR02218 family)
MRTPQWERYPGALAEYLGSAKHFFEVDLYTIVLLGGQVLRFAEWNQPITINGVTWGIGPGFGEATTEISRGITVDTLDVSIYDYPADNAKATLINGGPLMTFIESGGLDNAQIFYLSAYIVPAYLETPMPLLADGSFYADGSHLLGPQAGALTELETPVGTLLHFVGRVGDINPGRGHAQLSVESETKLLNASIPPHNFQPGCNNVVYDALCGVNRAAFTVKNMIASTTGDQSQTEIGHLLFGYATGYFDQGALRITSGPNAGQLHTVRRYIASSFTVRGIRIGTPIPGRITLFRPLLFPLVGGETFEMYPGCNGSYDNCRAPYNNVIHFYGTDKIPAENTAL